MLVQLEAEADIADRAHVPQGTRAGLVKTHSTFDHASRRKPQVGAEISLGGEQLREQWFESSQFRTGNLQSGTGLCPVRQAPAVPETRAKRQVTRECGPLALNQHFSHLQACLIKPELDFQVEVLQVRNGIAGPLEFDLRGAQHQFSDRGLPGTRKVGAQMRVEQAQSSGLSNILPEESFRGGSRVKAERFAGRSNVAIEPLSMPDPSAGTRFSTYAVWWIRAYVGKYLKEARSSVRPQSGTVAQADLSLDSAVDEDNETTHIERIEDDSPGPEDNFLANEADVEVRDALGRIRKRVGELGWDIIHSRLQQEQPRTLEEIGKRWGVSRERVRQVELKTKQFLHRYLQPVERDAA